MVKIYLIKLYTCDFDGDIWEENLFALTDLKQAEIYCRVVDKAFKHKKSEQINIKGKDYKIGNMGVSFGFEELELDPDFK